jgi:hypothetical protein
VCAPAAGSPVPGASLPPPVVLQSLRRGFSVLTPGSKSFPPRRDARNANNQPSAPAWTGIGGQWGVPGPSWVHPRAGPGGDTKKPGTPTPIAGARRDPQGAPPAAKFTAPRAPRCPLPGEVSHGPAGSRASRDSRGPPGLPAGLWGLRRARARLFPALPLSQGALGRGAPRGCAHRCLPGREARAGVRPDLLRAPLASLPRWRPSIALPLALPCGRRLAAQPSALRSGLEATDHAPRPPGPPSPALAAARSSALGAEPPPCGHRNFPSALQTLAGGGSEELTPNAGSRASASVPTRSWRQRGGRLS